MGDDKQAKEAAKVEKKATKARAKAFKKGGQTEVQPPEPTEGRLAERPAEPVVQAQPPNGSTPAERSAAAAERTVAINQRRFIVQIVAAIITLGAVLIALWSYLKPASHTTTTPASPPTTSRPTTD